MLTLTRGLFHLHSQAEYQRCYSNNMSPPRGAVVSLWLIVPALFHLEVLMWYSHMTFYCSVKTLIQFDSSSGIMLTDISWKLQSTEKFSCYFFGNYFLFMDGQEILIAASQLPLKLCLNQCTQQERYSLLSSCWAYFNATAWLKFQAHIVTRLWSQRGCLPLLSAAARTPIPQCDKCTE